MSGEQTGVSCAEEIVSRYRHDAEVLRRWRCDRCAAHSHRRASFDPVEYVDNMVAQVDTWIPVHLVSWNEFARSEGGVLAGGPSFHESLGSNQVQRASRCKRARHQTGRAFEGRFDRMTS